MKHFLALFIFAVSYPLFGEGGGLAQGQLNLEVSIRLLNNEREIIWESRTNHAAVTGVPVSVTVNSQSGGYINITLIFHVIGDDNFRYRMETVNEILWQSNGRRVYRASVNLLNITLGTPVFLYPLGTDELDGEDGHFIEVMITTFGQGSADNGGGAG